MDMSTMSDVLSFELFANAIIVLSSLIEIV